MKPCLARHLLLVSAAAAMVMMIAFPATAGKQDDTLNIAWCRELETLDRYYNSAREGMVVSRHVFDDLIYRDPFTGAYKPLLAKSFRWVDERTLEFELREGVKFHNGEKFDADDVVFTLNRMSAPESKVLVRRNVSWIRQARKLGPYSVRILLQKPFPAALEYLAGNLPIYPDGYYARVGPRRFGINPVGTGPYKVTRVEPGRKIVFEKNMTYFKESPKGQPAIARVVQRTIPDMTTMMAELITGGLDWVYMIPGELAEKLERIPSLTTACAETMRIGFLQLDAAGRFGKTPLNDIRVRRAIIHAIDRESIAKNLVGENARVIHSHCHPTQFGCSQEVMKYAYDPEKARELLAEAGYPDGFAIDFYGYRDRPYGEAVAGYLRQVGITANLRWLKYAALREKTHAGKTPFVMVTWGSYGINDVSNITGHYFRFGKNDMARDPRVRDWLERGDSAMDERVRKGVYAKALGRIAEQALCVPLFTWVANYAFTRDLDFTPSPDAVPRFFLSRWR